MTQIDKLYVIVRKDLKPGLQLSQSCHAAMHFYFDYPKLTEDWIKNSDFIVILNIEDEQKLQELLKTANKLNIAASAFYEPDLNNELTAIALAPCQMSKKLCRGLPLALKTF